MVKHLLIISLSVLAIHASAGQSFAQSDLSVGYQFVRLSIADGTFNLPAGFGVDYTHRIAGGWGVLGAFDWSRDRESGPVAPFFIDASFTQLAIGGGVRREIRTRTKAVPYVQAAVGLARSSRHAASNGSVVVDDSSTDLMLQPGVGLAAGLSDHLGVFGQFDYRRLWPDDNSDVFFNETVQGFRVFVGARISMQ